MERLGGSRPLSKINGRVARVVAREAGIGDLPSELPIHRTVASHREHSLDLTDEPLKLLGIAEVRQLAAWRTETERNVCGHGSNRTRRPGTRPVSLGERGGYARPMNRRGVTVLVGCLLLALLIWPVGTFTVPYVALGPGPTVDTLGVSDKKPVITVSGVPTTKSAGQLRLVTVSVQPDLTIAEALRGWWADDDAVVPRELVYPPDKTEKEVNDDNDRDFKQSQSSAETAALRELGYPVEVTVDEVSVGLPASGVLEVGDVITAVDGVAATSSQHLVSLVKDKPAGATREIRFRRGGEERTVQLKTAKSDDGDARIGVTANQRQPHPFTLEIQLDRIGGPSAGLMFALGIIDTIQPEDLTGGLIISGTGSIDDDGNVGPIGGIHQKLIAAKNQRSKAFLTPAENCGEAVRNAPRGMMLVKVRTLHDALTALADLRQNRTPRLCGQ